MQITITKEDFDRLVEHARSVSPKEACGLVAGEETTDGKREIKRVWLLTNIDHDEEHFSTDPREQLTAVKEMRSLGLTPLGNWHSHPASPSRPSEEDKRLANDSRASYLILSLEGEEPVMNAFHIEDPAEKRTVRKGDLIIR